MNDAKIVSWSTSLCRMSWKLAAVLALPAVVRHLGSGGDTVTNTATFQTGSQTGSAQAAYNTVERLSIYLPVVMRD